MRTATRIYGKMPAAIRLSVAAGICALCLPGCSREQAAVETEPALARVGTATITAADVRAAMPSGLSADDSVKFVRAYVNSWVDEQLIVGIASQQVDMDAIDRLADDYRRSLIMQEYRRQMYESHAASIPEDSLRAYHEAHGGDFLLDRPMVRGVYIKVPDDAPGLRRMRKLFRSDRTDDIDALEKEVLGSAIHYDYFRDKWVDWEQIEMRVPVDFAGWPGRGQTLDTSAGGFTYLLRVTDVLPAGSPMPYEQARPLIVQRMLAADRRTYDARMMAELRRSAADRGDMVVNLDR